MWQPGRSLIPLARQVVPAAPVAGCGSHWVPESVVVVDDGTIEETWSNELLARVDDIVSGTVATIPGDQVLADIALTGTGAAGLSVLLLGD